MEDTKQPQTASNDQSASDFKIPVTVVKQPPIEAQQPEPTTALSDTQLESTKPAAETEAPHISDQHIAIEPAQPQSTSDGDSHQSSPGVPPSPAASSTPTTEVSVAPAPDNAEFAAKGDSATVPNQDVSSTPDKTKNPGNGAPIGAIAAAIVIAVLLIGVSIIAFIKTRSTQPSASNLSSTNSQTSSSATTTQATISSGEVEETTNDIDDSINSLSSTDINTTDLSDSSLGL